MPSKKEVDFLAKIANASYQEPKKRALYTKTYGLSDRGLIYDGDFSDNHHAIFLDDKNKKIYMSVRGTSLDKGFKTGFEDLTDDLAVATNNISITRRYRQADKKLNELKERYPDSEIILSSHSLGGAVNYELTKKHGVISHNFSTGAGYKTPKDIKRFSTPDKYRKANFYHTKEFDILSETSKLLGGTHRAYNQKEGVESSHSLVNFMLESEVK